MKNISKEHREDLIQQINQLDIDNNLKEQLLSEINHSNYKLYFDTYEEDYDIKCKDKTPILIEDKNKSINSNQSINNILIEGDNLHSLNILKETYQNKVNVIYIDPPYNTGNKFKYKDKWKHDEWLSFMERRLTIARELLTEDGVIFISIDDNEYSNLKLLCDNIFGEENFIACIHRKTTAQQQNMGKNIAFVMEICIIICKKII